MFQTKKFETQQIWLVLSTLFFTIIWFLWRQSYGKKKQLVGHVAEIRCHPVKSGKPIQMDNIEVTKRGLVHDRQFCLLNQYGTFTTLRKYPKFVLIEQTILEDQIRLRVDGMSDLYLPLHMEKKDGDHVREVTVWKITTEGVHVSNDVDDWFSIYLGVDGCKLYCFPTDGLSRESKDKGYGKFEMMFPDGCPLLITSKASLEDLNSKFTGELITMDRFRPNIVLTGCAPYGEDEYDLIQIGNHVTMKALWACERCVAVNIDPSKGETSNNNLLKYLESNRPGTIYNAKQTGGVFGRNYGVDSAGNIKVGDPVYKLS